MKAWLILLLIPAISFGDITWLVNYKGGALPDSIWIARGKVNATIKGSALRLVDDSDQEGCFRAKWKAEPDKEIVVEARVKVGAVKASRGGQSIWPWRDGAPIGVLVSDGRHQEGLSLIPKRVATFTDRFFVANTASAFHTYRLVIRGNDMSVFMDDKLCIRGAGAFWKPADSPEPFIQFGSNAKAFTSDAQWEFVRLGVLKPTAAPAPERLKISISAPWDITRPDKVRMTRSYLYDMGGGLLLMSVAEGPDAYFEPYGVLKSTDAGKTWTPVKGLEKLEEAPQPMVRMADGSIVGVSRWNRRRADGVLVGHTVRLDERAEKFTMFEHEIHLPAEAMAEKRPVVLVFDRHIFAEPDGSITAVGYGYARGGRAGHLLRSADAGKTWRHFSTIPDAGEPAVARLSPTEMTTVYRTGTLMPMAQVWSHDAGKTWSAPVTLEEGSVSPDIVLMSNGVLACSYGRPASCIMFSLDKGKTWESHRVITDKTGFNYSAIREIRPGRLLYVHDAPQMNAVYVDVEITMSDDFVAYIQRAANGDNFGLRADGRFYPYSTPQGQRIGWRQPVWDKALFAKGCTKAEAEQRLRADLERTLSALRESHPGLDQRQEETLLDFAYTEGIGNLKPEFVAAVLVRDWERIVKEHLHVRYAGHAPDHSRNKAFAARWNIR